MKFPIRIVHACALVALALGQTGDPKHGEHIRIVGLKSLAVLENFQGIFRIVHTQLRSSPVLARQRIGGAFAENCVRFGQIAGQVLDDPKHRICPRVAWGDGQNLVQNGLGRRRIPLGDQGRGLLVFLRQFGGRFRFELVRVEVLNVVGQQFVGVLSVRRFELIEADTAHQYGG